jgi:hypothetical protein
MGEDLAGPRKLYTAIIVIVNEDRGATTFVVRVIANNSRQALHRAGEVVDAWCTKNGREYLTDRAWSSEVVLHGHAKPGRRHNKCEYVFLKA